MRRADIHLFSFTTTALLLAASALGCIRSGFERWGEPPPGPPRGFTATPISPFQIDLTWEAPASSPEVVGYRLSRDGVALASTPAVRFSDFGLRPGEEYRYALVAVSRLGTASSEATAGTATPAAGGTTYVVAPPPCDDAGTGSDDQPWCTLQAAADSVRPGDTVRVRPGRYAGFLLERSGTEASPIVFAASAHGVIVDTGNEDGDGIRVLGVSHLRVEGFTVVGVAGRGISVSGPSSVTNRRVAIVGNSVDTPGDYGIGLTNTADSLIDGNRVTDAGSFGIEISNGGADGNLVRGNVVTGSAASGLFADGDASVVTADGIVSGLAVVRNLFAGCGANGVAFDGVQESVVENNLILDNDRGGLRPYWIDGAAGPRDLVIANNTIRAGGADRWCIRVTESGDDIVIFNNLLVGGGGLSVDSVGGLTSGHNGVSGLFEIGEGNTVDLTAWQAEGQGAGSHSLDDAAVFLDAALDPRATPGAAQLGFSLRADAAAIDRGALSFAGNVAPLLDFGGADRPQGGGADIGAIERSGE